MPIFGLCLFLVGGGQRFPERISFLPLQLFSIRTVTLKASSIISYVDIESFSLVIAAYMTLNSIFIKC